MGQLISSSQDGKHSRAVVSTSSISNSPSQIEFENSIHYLPNLKVDLENGDFDLSTRWEPQQLTRTHIPNETHLTQTHRGRPKISFSSCDVGKLQTTTESDYTTTIKETGENEPGSLSDRTVVLGDEKNLTGSSTDIKGTETDEKDDYSCSAVPNTATRSRRQCGRKELMREVHDLLHSASLDDMSQIVSYLKTHDVPLVVDSSDESFSDESSYLARSSRRGGITSRSQLGTQASNEHLRRRSSTSKVNTLSTRTSQEHILALKPSSAYLPSLRPSSSYQSFLKPSLSRSSSRRNSLSSQKSDDYPTLSLSRQTSSSRTLRSSVFSSAKGIASSASSLWSPTSEETDTYRINILSNLHYCTYGCKGENFKRKSDWIRHEEQIHEPPVIHTCLLHVSETLSSDPCPARRCVSTMDSGHLAHFHDSFSCFDKPALSIERYQTEKAELLLEHLRERHGLALERFPDYWSSESLRKTRWWCGFCQGILKSWKERVDHISLHFTREGLTVDRWKDLSTVPFPPVAEDEKQKGGSMVKEVSLGQLSLAQLKRLSVVKECQQDDTDDEDI